MSEGQPGQRALLPVPTGGRARADDWALVLTSQSIPVRVLHTPSGWALELDAGDLPSAETTLTSYERERGEAQLAHVAAKQERESFAPRGPRWAGVPIGFALLATFAYSGDRAAGHPLFAQGSALGSRILEGEWWRCVTALCLHANLEHVLSNVLALVFFMGLVCRMLGLGFGFALILTTGALGNAVNAIVQPPNHNSVGASTAIFGAIGLLSGLAVVRQYRSDLHVRRAWVPIGAGLALLAMLGTGGEHVDLEAHFFGLLFGIILGAAVALRLKQAPPPPVQWMFGSAAFAMILLCWTLALR